MRSFDPGAGFPLWTFFSVYLPVPIWIFYNLLFYTCLNYFGE